MRLSIVAAALAFLAIPTLASAHAGNDDLNVVHGCINNGSKIVRIVGVSGSCNPAETPAHWDIQGPPGTNGTNGTNGIDGTSVTFVGYFSGNLHGCANGGAIYAAGTPPVNAHICNGTNGTNGIDGQDGTNGATNPDPPCFDNINRYVNCGNGTVTDTVMGLIWLKQANCFADGRYAVANQAAAGLKEGDCSLTDGSSPGDWRLPTKDEWSATVARAVALGCTGANGPLLTKDAGTTCFGDGTASSFAGVASVNYWSSSTFATDPSFAWGANLLTNAKFDSLRVWPVRGGPR